MCDIYKYDEDNYQVDGDMYSADELKNIDSWHQVSTLLGSNRADQMKEFGFEPSDIIEFMNRVARDAA